MTHSLPDKHEKKAFFIGGILIVLVIVYFVGKNIFFNNENAYQAPIPTGTEKDAGIPVITPDVLLKKIYAGDPLALLDIRDEASFQIEHIAHSVALPIGALANYAPAREETVVIIFSELDPSAFETAKNILSQKSFPYFFLKGGFEGWKKQGAPLLSIGDPNSFLDQSKVTFITVEELKQFMQQNASAFFILDVQEENNFKKKHLKGAVNIPLGQLEKRADLLPAGTKIVVYGETDLLSYQGGVRLFDLNFYSARTLSGDQHLSSESGLQLEP